MAYYHKMMQSPVGELRLIASDKGLAAVLWDYGEPDHTPVTESSIESNDHPVLLEAEQQLTEYFEKKRTAFTLELDFIGTEFQKKGLACHADDSLWRDPNVRTDRKTNRQSRCCARGWRRGKQKSDPYHCALSPGDRRFRQAGWIWRRTSKQVDLIATGRLQKKSNALVTPSGLASLPFFFLFC